MEIREVPIRVGDRGGTMTDISLQKTAKRARKGRGLSRPNRIEDGPLARRIRSMFILSSMMDRASFSFRSPTIWRQGSTRSAALQNGRPGCIDVGHQLMGLLIAAVGVVALGQHKIGGRELLGGDRPDVDPEPLEQRHSIIGKQLS